MRILLIHNTYKYKGGEDSVFENEYNLLVSHNNQVEKLLFTNKNIHSLFDKIKVGINAIYNPKSAKILEEKIKLFQPEVIHVHNFFPVASPALFYVANQLNIPIVITLHNYRLICPNALLFRENKVCEKCIQKSFAIDGVLNGCYRNSKIQTFSLALMSYIHKKKATWHTKIDKYITLTNFAKQKLLSSSLGVHSDQFIIKPNFVEDFGCEYEKEDYFLFVGRLSLEKGVNLLLEAFIKSKQKLLIIGSGPLEKKVIEFANKYTNIIYLGFQDKQFIIEKLKRAKALLFTSLWYEGMPMTILESFSTATPVIAPNIGGPNEIVHDKKNGLIYQVNNLKNLQEKIVELTQENSIYKRFCIEARKSYENYYTPERNYQQLITLYKEMISS